MDRYYREGRIREIADYCESDVLNTFRVWLRYELFQGGLSVIIRMSRVASARQRSSSRFIARVLLGAKPAPFPGFIEPALATPRIKIPTGARFVHELKLDGYRVQTHLLDGRVRLYTRSGLDWTNRFPTIATDVGRLPAGKLVMDGEVISADARGHPSFSALQVDLKRGRHHRMVFYAFDLLHLDGFDTRAAPLIERKRVRQSFLAEAGTTAPRVLYSEHSEDGVDLYSRGERDKGRSLRVTGNTMRRMMLDMSQEKLGDARGLTFQQVQKYEKYPGSARAFLL